MEHFLTGVTIPPQSVVAGYWPVKSELDVMPLLLELIKRGHRCCLPQVTDFKRPLAFREWHEGAKMTDGRFGIRQPDPETCDPVLPGVILVPLLGFDGRGQRLGYGSGFYDRTFDSLKGHKYLRIGVAYDIQRLEEVPIGPYDVPMNMIITEKTIYHFRTGP